MYPSISSVPKTTPQSKSRRQSVVGSRNSTSAADDFEELINEFTEDHLDEEVDPGIGEDDLLQELSDMIGSWGHFFIKANTLAQRNQQHQHCFRFTQRIYA